MNTVTTAPVERPSRTYSTTARIKVALQVIPLKIIETLRSNDSTAIRTSLKK